MKARSREPCFQHLRPDATALNATETPGERGKGVLNNRISVLFQHLNRPGVTTHFPPRLNMREQLIRERDRAAGAWSVRK